MPGTGPTWLSGMVSLPDRHGIPHLVASYVKIKPPLEAYERGLCVWNEAAERFQQVKVIWTHSPLRRSRHANPMDIPHCGVTTWETAGCCLAIRCRR